MAANPNYFGTISTAALKPVKKSWSPSTKYEELTCVGYKHNLEMLEATIRLKLPYSYGGSDLCDSGSTEYVKFFLNYGSGWNDGGLAAVNVHDIADSDDYADKPTKPLNYVVTRSIEPKSDQCSHPVLPKGGIIKFPVLDPKRRALIPFGIVMNNSKQLSFFSLLADYPFAIKLMHKTGAKRFGKAKYP